MRDEQNRQGEVEPEAAVETESRSWVEQSTSPASGSAVTSPIGRGGEDEGEEEEGGKEESEKERKERDVKKGTAPVTPQRTRASDSSTATPIDSDWQQVPGSRQGSQSSNSVGEDEETGGADERRREEKKETGERNKEERGLGFQMDWSKSLQSIERGDYLGDGEGGSDEEEDVMERRREGEGHEEDEALGDDLPDWECLDGIEDLINEEGGGEEGEGIGKWDGRMTLLLLSLIVNHVSSLSFPQMQSWRRRSRGTWGYRLRSSFRFVV